MSEVKVFPIKANSVAVKQAAMAALGQAVQEREAMVRKGPRPLPGVLECRLLAKQKEINALAAHAFCVGAKRLETGGEP